MIKALLFDFNGVIINDEPIQMRVYQEILATEDIVLTDADYHSCLGMDDRGFVEAAYARAGRAPEPNKVLEVVQRKTEKWHDVMADGIPLFENVDNFIRKMAKDFSLGIVSMARREEVSHILEQTRLAECFDVVVTADEVTKSKPDPECYRTGFRQLDLARMRKGHLPMIHSECVVIEDSPAGVQAARAADLPALGVTNTVTAEDLRAAGAEWIAKDLNDWFPDSIRRAFA